MAQTMKNKVFWLALVAPWFLVSGGMFAQTDVVIRWVDEQGKSASQNELAGIVLHVSSWLDGVTRDAVQSEVLVVDSAGWCQWPQVADGVYNLEALPWSWTVVVEGWNGSAGIDSLTLIWPNEPIAGLRGNPADVIYPANHPGSQLARLDRWSQYTLDSLDAEPRVLIDPNTWSADGTKALSGTYFSDDGKTAYVSNFLGDSISVIDMASNKQTALIKSGKQPAMLAIALGLSCLRAQLPFVLGRAVEQSVEEIY